MKILYENTSEDSYGECHIYEEGDGNILIVHDVDIESEQQCWSEKVNFKRFTDWKAERKVKESKDLDLEDE